MSQHIPVDDFDEAEITPEHVTARVDDWLRRLDTLFRTIKDWADSRGWFAADAVPVRMHEEMMLRFGVSEREQPALSVRSPDGSEISIKPKGLWVIGANGRVDIYSPKGVFTLIDVADAFQAPQWVLHRLGEGKGRPFVPEQLSEMV